MRRPTLHDVAAEAGVSIKTVSRVVNGGPHVRPEVVDRVQVAVDKLHYVPNTLARSLKAGEGDTIGVVIDTIADPFFAALTSAVEQRALSAGLGTVFGSTGFDPARERGQVERMAMQQVRALVLAPTEGPHDYVRRFATSFPIIAVDRVLTVAGHDTVRVDDTGLAHRAIAHLTDRGHRRIAFVGSDERYVTTRDRLVGYRRALADVGVEPRPEWIRPGPTVDVDASAVTVDLLGLAEPPTAIFAGNPRASIGVVHALHRDRRTDVAFVSFGDFPLAATLDPGVTCVDQDPAAIGQAAMDRALRRIGDGRADAPVDLVVDAVMHERGSGEISVPA